MLISHNQWCLPRCGL